MHGATVNGNFEGGGEGVRMYHHVSTIILRGQGEREGISCEYYCARVWEEERTNRVY